MYVANLKSAYKLMQENCFNWYDKKELNNLKELLLNSKDLETKKKISEYILGKIANFEDDDWAIERRFCQANNLKELNEAVSEYVEEINFYKELYLACNTKDELMTNYMNRIINRLLKAINSCFLDLYAYLTDTHIDIKILDDDKYFTALTFPFTLKELSDYRKKIAKIYHPDNGGSQEDMAKINEIFDVLKLMAN